MTPLAIIQARMGSTRLPGKVMLRLGGKPVLQHVIERTRQAVERVVVAIPDTAENDVLADLCGWLKVDVTRGPEADVLARFQKAVREHPCDYIIRVTADCPLVEPEILRIIMAEMERGAGYCNLTWHQSELPDGLGAEGILAGLVAGAPDRLLKYDQEHVTPWFYRLSAAQGPRIMGEDGTERRPFRNVIAGVFVDYTCSWPPAPAEYRRPYPLTLDTWDDYAHLCMLWALVSKGGEAPATLDVLRWLDEHPEAARYNTRGSPLTAVRGTG